MPKDKFSFARQNNNNQTYKFGEVQVGTTEQVITQMSSAAAILPQHTVSVALPARVKAGGNAADTLAGTGGQVIRIYGIDEKYQKTSSDINLAGASASSETTETYLRIYRASVIQAGTGFKNVADIIIELNDGTEMIIIPASLSQSQHMAYTIPDSHTGYVLSLDINTDSTKSADFFIYTKGMESGTAQRRIAAFYGISGSKHIEYNILPQIPEKTDIWITGKVASGTANVSTSGSIVYPNTG
jgi:hypothetical protein